MAEQTLYFISETAPVNTHASSVVFYRHFSLLEKDGYRIVWVTDRNSFDKNAALLPGTWSALILPNRAFHLPPYRPGGFAQRYRFSYYYRRFLKKQLSKTREALLVTFIHGQFLAPFAAYLQKKTQLPLLSFFHDDPLELNYSVSKSTLKENIKKVLAASNLVLTVSEGFRANWPEYATRFRLLYPIPAEEMPLLPRRGGGIVTLCYAGAVYDEIVPWLHTLAGLLEKLDQKLIIIGDQQKTMHIADKFPKTVSCYPFFDTPEEASLFMLKNCDGAVIPYPEEIAQMPWIVSCFPSKFVQYCQLNLPAIVLAPTDSAIGRWCYDHDWPLYAQRYQLKTLGELLNKLVLPETRKMVGDTGKKFFDPKKIQQQFKEIVEDLVNISPA